MAHHTTAKNTGLVLLYLYSKSQHTMSKKLGSDTILISFYLKKIKLFLGFGYNQLHHTKCSLPKEQLNQEVNANSSK